MSRNYLHIAVETLGISVLVVLVADDVCGFVGVGCSCESVSQISAG